MKLRWIFKVLIVFIGSIGLVYLTVPIAFADISPPTNLSSKAISVPTPETDIVRYYNKAKSELDRDPMSAKANAQKALQLIDEFERDKSWDYTGESNPRYAELWDQIVAVFVTDKKSTDKSMKMELYE